MKSTFKAGGFLLLLAALACIGIGTALSSYMGLDSEFVGARPVINKVLYFKYYITEFFVMLILIYLSSGKTFVASLVRRVIAPVIFSVWIVQFLAFWFSGEFVSPLVLENTRAAATIVSWNSVAVAVAFCLSGFGLYVALKWIVGFSARRVSGTQALGLIIVTCFGLYIADNNLGGDHKEQMREVARSMVNGRTPPFSSFSMLIADFNSPSEYLEHETYSFSDQLRAAKLGLRVKWDSEHPMVHQQYYSKALPFRRLDPGAKPNVIVLFVESLSARKLNSYGSTVSKIVPHLENLASRSLVVDNYYGHTQSTFRGIRGQLCSMFPFHTSRKNQWADVNFKFPETTYDCLPHHLAANGYDTIFMGPDHSDHMHFRSQTTSMGFRQNLYRRDIHEKYLGNTKLTGRFLTDAQMANGLAGFIQDPPPDQPFFLASYFKGAHLGLNSHTDGKLYGDGSNRVLNTLHSFDEAFGLFWEKFSSSSLFNNTIVVVTGDHSHWPEKTYIKIAGDDFNHTPIDRIALMIYSPFHEFPARYDAKYSTSLGFAPMITQLVDLPHATNSFIGVSPFERETAKPSFAWFNERVYIINENDKVDFYNIRRDQLPALASSAWKAVKQTHIAEFTDRIVKKYPYGKN